MAVSHHLAFRALSNEIRLVSPATANRSRLFLQSHHQIKVTYGSAAQ